MATQLNLVFMGTPEFAAVILRRLLLYSGSAVQAVFTQPDRPQGRGRKTRFSPVKSIALEAGLAVYQPTSLTNADTIKLLHRLNPELLIVAAYGLLLPPAVLGIPRHGALNVHASLLPKYRGAAPIQRALADGEHITGISIMSMQPGLDCGPVLLQRAIPISLDDTAATLHDKLADLGGECLIQALERFQKGNIRPVPQDEALASHAPKLRKEEGRIDWNQPAHKVHNHIRAMHPWPGAFTQLRKAFDEKPLTIQIFPGRLGSKLQADAVPGTIQAGPDESLLVACSDRYYQILTLKPASRRPMSASAFICGYLAQQPESGQGRFL